MIKNIELYILIFFIYAFAGWCLESIGGIFNLKSFKIILSFKDEIRDLKDNTEEIVNKVNAFPNLEIKKKNKD